MLYVCIEYHILVNKYHVSAQGVDERMINVHHYYCLLSLPAVTVIILRDYSSYRLLSLPAVTVIILRDYSSYRLLSLPAVIVIILMDYSR